MLTKLIAHVHGAGTIQGWGLFQFKGGKNSRKYGTYMYVAASTVTDNTHTHIFIHTQDYRNPHVRMH